MQGDGRKDRRRKTSASFLQMYSSPDKCCQQPAEGTAEQTLLETCNTSISLSFWPLSMKANLYHRHKPGLKRLCPCATGSGEYAVSNLFSITGLESKPPDTHPLWHMSKLTGLWSSTCRTNGQLSISRHYVRNSSILPKQGTCFPLCGTV